ncbi:hypothetical protein ACQKWADRAFT_323058 [Trichoderma austrokoningii]
MDYDSIIEWIDRLEPASDTASLILAKPSAPKTASPPPSYAEGVGDNNMSSASRKRRRVGSQGGLVDPNATPRPGSRSIPGSAAFMSASESEPSSSSLRQSSVKRQIMSLQFGNAGIEYEILKDDLVPEAARMLFATMTEIEQRFNILPDAMRDTIKNDQGFTDQDFKRSQWNYCFKSANKPNNLPGRIPEQCDDFNAILCTTARLHREFTHISSSSSANMIDICLVAAVKAFSSTTPTQSTKQPGGGNLEKAQLQMGVWLSLHWAFLYWGVKQKLLKQHMALGLDAPTDNFKAETLNVLSTLGFIPGILINGCRWYLVLSTYKDGKTTLWTDWTFGETKTLMKTYAVIAGVRELTAWARDRYIP